MSESIFMVDGYEAPGFDGYKRRKKRRGGSKRRRHRKGSKMSASKVCAGAKRRKLCLRVAGRGLRKR